VAGLEKPTQGQLPSATTKVDGTPRSEIPAEERNLGLVFQSYALWPHKTVFENVAYPLKLRKVATAKRSTSGYRVCWINWAWDIWVSAIRISFPAASNSA
jgi:ABC-type Fe3+/spermidine/putrescine transport system ATPase subunit